MTEDAHVHFVVTGHTGFKGSWLALALVRRGHEVTGMALAPPPGGLFERARVAPLVRSDLRVDVRDRHEVRRAMVDAAPDVVVHLAAQSLVRPSYRDPRTTVDTNVVGTMNMLEAVHATGSVQAHLVVTTDKVYRNDGRPQGYREHDPLGAADPYSTSKAAADLLTQSWMASTPGVAPTAIARAGNVVGGGDVSPERLVVDLLRAFEEGRPAVVRNPDAVRPWQHVLDCLGGYLHIIDALLEGRATGEAFNIGPDIGVARDVATVADRLAELWGGGASWHDVSERNAPREAAVLSLDPTAARVGLGWSGRLGFEETMAMTVDWARRTSAGEDPRAVSWEQVDAVLGDGAPGPRPR